MRPPDLCGTSGCENKDGIIIIALFTPAWLFSCCFFPWQFRSASTAFSPAQNNRSLLLPPTTFETIVVRSS